MTVHTASETCELLRISRWTLQRLEKSGELVPLRIGTHLRYRDSDIENYLNSLALQAVAGDPADTGSELPAQPSAQTQLDQVEQPLRRHKPKAAHRSEVGDA